MTTATVASYLSWLASCPPRNTFNLLQRRILDCVPLRRARSVKLARITIEGISSDTTNQAASASALLMCACRPPSPPLSGSVLLNLPEWVGSDFAISLFSLNDPADGRTGAEQSPSSVGTVCLDAEQQRGLARSPVAVPNDAHGGYVS